MIDYQEALVGKIVMPRPDAKLVISGDPITEPRRCLAATVRHHALRITTFSRGDIQETDIAIADTDDDSLPAISDFVIQETSADS